MGSHMHGEDGREGEVVSWDQYLSLNISLEASCRVGADFREGAEHRKLHEQPFVRSGFIWMDGWVSLRHRWPYTEVKRPLHRKLRKKV